MKGLDLNTTSAGHRPWEEISDPSVAEVASRFGTPPPEYGLILWWGWTAPMTEAVITRDLDEIGARGIREDPTHPATAACQHIEAPLPTTQDFLETLDVVGYNCVYRWGDRSVKYYSIDHERYPHRRMIGSEHGSVAGVRGDYSLAERQVGRAGRFRWGPYQSRMLRAEWLWKFSRTYDYVAGDFLWIGIDNLGGCGGGHSRTAAVARWTCAASRRTASTSTRASGRTNPCFTSSHTGPGRVAREKSCQS